MNCFFLDTYCGDQETFYVLLNSCACNYIYIWILRIDHEGGT
jgi:hypothetical protein